MFDLVSNLWLDSMIKLTTNDGLASSLTNLIVRWLDCEQSDKPICWLDWSLKVNVDLTVNSL